MYKVGLMPAVPSGQGGSEGEGSGCPGLRQPERGQAAPAPWPCRDGVPRLGAWPCPPRRAPLCPPPCTGAMGGRDPPSHPASQHTRPTRGSGDCSAAPCLRPGIVDLLLGIRGGVWGCGESGAEAGMAGARRVLGPVPGHGGVSGSRAREQAAALTTALGAARVVPGGGAGAGGRWALLALAVRLPRLRHGMRG